MNDDLKTVKKDSKIKKEYAPPKFRRFGAIRELTSGGTGNANEGAGGGGAKPRP